MELEIKYSPVGYEIFKKIAEDFGCDEPKTIKMLANYYDTEDGLLSKSKTSFRCRIERELGEGLELSSENAVYTIKHPLGMKNGVAIREEYEVTADKLDSAIEKLISGYPISRELGELLRTKGLITIAKMDFVRKAAAISDENGNLFELSHDIGTMYGKKLSAPICEMEIELKRGSEEALMNFVKQFEKYNLRLETHSKLHRAKKL